MTVVIKKMQLQPFNEEDKAVFGEGKKTLKVSHLLPFFLILTIIMIESDCKIKDLMPFYTKE